MNPRETTEQDSSEADRRSVSRSARRLNVAFTTFVVALLVGTSALTFLMVTRIFERLTPSTRHDLAWKARRGAQELARSTQLGMLVADADSIATAAADYVHDGEVLALRVQDADGVTIYQHLSPLLHDDTAAALFAGSEGEVHENGQALSAWASSEIEGSRVGRVGLAVSKARLAAGEQLRGDILRLAAFGALFALLLTLAFVHFYIGPILQTTSRTFERLEKTTEEALEATRLKSEFLANMTHEIRTPMNGIVGVLDLVRRTPLSSKQRRYVQTIESSARSLLSIINDILDFSKIEAGKYQVQRRPMDLEQVVQEVAELLAPRAHGKGIDLISHVSADVPAAIEGDPDRLKQVLTNLVGNAIKFTEKGHVVIRVVRVAQEPSATDATLQLRFEVEDTGIGISADDQGFLFEKFSQVDGSLTRRYGGTGLGLAISKRLAAAMGGEIGLTSEPGAGSTFWFTIATRETPPHASSAHPRRAARVLLVARSRAQRESLSARLASWGMQAVETETVAQATALLGEGAAFDVAVLDLPRDAQGAMRDACALEGLAVLCMVPSTEAPPQAMPGLPQVVLAKPPRISELYNGLVALLEGGSGSLERHSIADNDNQPKRIHRRAHVLVVDDNEVNRLVACDLLTELGYDCETAENGAEAVRRVQQGGIEAILMDCQMPVMDGYEATRRIRALAVGIADVPILAATAHAMDGDREKVLAAGMDDYLPKPIREKALARLLDRWVQHAGETPIEPAGLRQPPPSAARATAGWSHLRVLSPSVRRSPRVVEVCLRTFPEDIRAVHAAMAAGDVQATRRAAHKLKGSSASLGLEQLSEAAREVEAEASHGRFANAPANALQALFEQAQAQLDPSQLARGTRDEERRAR